MIVSVSFTFHRRSKSIMFPVWFYFNSSEMINMCMNMICKKKKKNYILDGKTRRSTHRACIAISSTIFNSPFTWYSNMYKIHWPILMASCFRRVIIINWEWHGAENYVNHDLTTNEKKKTIPNKKRMHGEKSYAINICVAKCNELRTRMHCSVMFEWWIVQNRRTVC